MPNLLHSVKCQDVMEDLLTGQGSLFQDKSLQTNFLKFQITSMVCGTPMPEMGLFYTCRLS
jgi:hypothetical protein